MFADGFAQVVAVGRRAFVHEVEDAERHIADFQVLCIARQRKLERQIEAIQKVLLVFFVDLD